MCLASVVAGFSRRVCKQMKFSNYAYTNILYQSLIFNLPVLFAINVVWLKQAFCEKRSMLQNERRSSFPACQFGRQAGAGIFEVLGGCDELIAKCRAATRLFILRVTDDSHFFTPEGDSAETMDIPIYMQGDKLQSVSSDTNFNHAFLVRCVPIEDGASMKLELDTRTMPLPKSVVNIMTKTSLHAQQNNLIRANAPTVALPTSIDVSWPYLSPKEAAYGKTDLELCRTQLQDEMLPKKGAKRKGAPEPEVATDILEMIGSKGAKIKLARISAGESGNGVGAKPGVNSNVATG